MSEEVTSAGLKEKYDAAWKVFIDSVTKIAEKIQVEASAGNPVHSLLTAVYDVPYRNAKSLVLKDSSVSSRLNPGPLGGLFFERMVGAAVLGYFKARLPEAKIYLGRSSPAYPRELPRDPDINIECQGRNVVFELKTSPKKSDLDNIEDLQRRYTEKGVKYLLCAGEVSAKRERIERILIGGWASFLDASRRNRDLISKTSVDAMLGLAERFLRGINAG